jgi:hypothetical protein
MTNKLIRSELYKGCFITVKLKKDGLFYGQIRTPTRGNKHLVADSGSVCMAMCEDYIEDKLNGN